MGCFLACFGFTKKRKRRKTGRRKQMIYEDQSYGRYVPLDSDVVTVKLDLVEMQNQNQNQNASVTKFCGKPTESSTSKIKKKVRFNLNVKSYEPLTINDDYDGYLSDGEEKKTVWELNREERSGTTTTTTRLEFEEEYHHPNASSKKIGGFCSSYPANYRYQNCRNSYSEDEDEIELDDSDFDSDDDNNLNSDGENDSNNKINSGSMESDKSLISSTAGLGELGKCKLDKLRDSSSTDQSISVLNPVENLTQWKAIKAKSKQQQIKQQKENNIVVQLQQGQNLPLSKHISKISSDSGRNAVDASLSKWLF